MALAKKAEQLGPMPAMFYVKHAFIEELSERFLKKYNDRLAIMENMLASELYCAIYTPDDVAQMLSTGRCVMRSMMPVRLSNCYLPDSIHGAYSLSLKLRERLPFALDSHAVEIDMSSRHDSMIQDLLRMRREFSRPPEFQQELDNIMRCSIGDCESPIEALIKLGKAGPVSNQLVYDMVQAQQAAAANPLGIGL